MGAYKKSLEREVKQLKVKISDLYFELKTAKGELFYTITSEINNLTVTLKAKQDRIRFIDRFPAHMPDNFNAETIMNTIR